MKGHLLLILLLTLSLITKSQTKSDTANFIKESFDSVFYRMVRTARSGDKDTKSEIVPSARLSMDLLLKMEEPTKYEAEISADTRRLITERQSQSPATIPFEIYALVQLERAIEDNDTLNLHLKEKLTKEISKQVTLLMRDQYPEYNYYNREKDLIKFISIRSGNDMFTLSGLFLNPRNEKGVFFQPNRDRDYTGSLLLEIGTDYLSTQRQRPLKTYQTLLYGFDVYTPYFRDTTVFKSDTSYNPLDRPHASFQYIGWSKKGLSLNDNFRWCTTVKIGKIGGHIGEKFQNLIHQDISYSPRPRGWGAQIANNGRFGFSLEFKEEFFQRKIADERGWRRLFLSMFSEQKVGSYMTNAGLGIRVTNKSFRESNMNFITHRPRRTANSIFDRLMYNAAFSATYVRHNTMLEGYGIFKTTESKNDDLTPVSRYYLKSDQVRRFVFTLNTTLSYTTRFATFFYNWYSFSPETYLGNIGIKSPRTGEEMNISKRWHHFAELGFIFNVH